MPKHYVYKDTKKNKTIFETIQANHISLSTVDMMVLSATGLDPRLNPIIIERTIRVVSDKFTINEPLRKRKK